MKYNINELASMMDAKLISLGNGNPQQQVSTLLTDSRSLITPSDTLFFALTSDRNDGHRYIASLHDRGVRCFVVNQNYEINLKEGHFFVVSDTLKALQQLAFEHRSRFDTDVIGITGSYGKTIVKEWLHQLMLQENKITRSPRSYNSQIGVPLSVWQMNGSESLCIFEAGISQTDEMQHLAPIIRPRVGILTNIGIAHQEGFMSEKAKCLEKIKLFAASEVIVYNADNPMVDECIKTTYPAKRHFNWSLHNKKATLFIPSVTRNTDHTTVVYRHNGSDNNYTLPFTDDASIENSIHCLALLLLYGYSESIIQSRMKVLEPVAMRMEVKEGINHCVLINDAYTSDLFSLEIALNFMSRRYKNNPSSKSIIISDISQTMLPGAELYRKVAELIKLYGITRMVGIGGEISSFASLFGFTEGNFFLTTQSFLDSGMYRSFHNEVVLIKGARRFQFEEIISCLEVKVHKTILEVNLDAIIHNFNYHKSLLNPSTAIIAMVKASGYGSGAVEVVKTLQEIGCSYVAVATADEGAELRHAGVYIPIMVMNPELSSLQTLINYNLEPEVYSFSMLERLRTVILRNGATPMPVHLKINSGMNRLGFSSDHIERLGEILNNQQELIVSSVFSHLAASDDPSKDAFTLSQIESFNHDASRLAQRLHYPFRKHILNSKGIVRFTNHQYDMVRLGIGLYCPTSAEEEDIRNVNTLKTTILQIHDIKSGESVGYGANNILTQETRIAIVPIGYADGLNRKLGNGKGEMMVNGQRAKITGTVCMDTTMIDITAIDHVTEGDEVIVFGHEMPLYEVAERLETIPYEVLTSVSSRVKRVYVKE